MRASKPYTPEQRVKIYEKAAKRILRDDNEYCCHAIEQASGIRDIKLNYFPEFKLFKPLNSFAAWFGNDSKLTNRETKIARHLCLLSCAEMIRQGIDTE